MNFFIKHIDNYLKKRFNKTDQSVHTGQSVYYKEWYYEFFKGGKKRCF